ncbi:hypothetical protein D3C76_1110140 [compost metagenome]
MPLLRIQRPHCRIRRLVRFEQRHQRTTVQVFQHVIIRQLAQPHPLQRRIQHCLPAVTAPVALYPLTDLAAVLLQRPQVRTAHQAIVPRQLRQAVRPAITFQVSRRGAQVHAPWRQAGCHQSRVGQAAQADGQVHAFVHQVEGVVAQFHIHPQLRVQRHEPCYQRHDEALAVGHRAGHAQQPLGFTGQVAHGTQGFLAAILQALAMLQKGLPRLAQGYPARAAVQQARLQALLQPGDLAAYVRRGNPQAFGGRCELARFGHGDEFVDALPAVAHGLSLCGNNVLSLA